jgi:membrane-anchored glycerophosphoryl diester phosphodiesterase (GDPDase)
MAQWELRPLSLGEILDRTFSLYRQNFLLFVGIMAIPHLLTLGVNLAQVLMTKTPLAIGQAPIHQLQAGTPDGGILALGIFGMLIAAIVFLAAFLFSHGGTIYAVSDLYLGRTTTISSSLRRMWGQLLNLFGVSVLNGLAVLAATIFLIIPGIYVACRLITCVPAALLEDLGARESLERSFALTKGNAGRAFGIYVIYLVMLYAVMLVFSLPSIYLLATAAKDPGVLRISMLLGQIGSFIAGTVVGPFFLIATSVFYYDLRVRKEAFDLQTMMNPLGVVPTGNSSVPSLLS